jgi:hypothetical protein
MSGEWRHAVAAALLGFGGVGGGESLGDTGTPLVSHHRHVVVTGLASPDALRLAVMAESVRGQLLNWAGAPLPLESPYALALRAETRAEHDPGAVLKAQGWSSDGRLLQELTLVQPERLSMDDARDGLVWLWLNRWVLVRQDGAERMAQPAAFPDWFAAGVARLLDPAERARHLSIWSESEARGIRFSAEAVMEGVYLPPGDRMEKSRAALFVAAWVDRVGTAAMLDAAATAVARGESLTAARVARLWGMPDTRSMMIAWDLWLAGQRDRITPGWRTGDGAGVDEVLALRIGDYGWEWPGFIRRGEGLEVEALIAAREEPWAMDVARRAAGRLQQVLIGKSPELVAAAQPALTFFHGIAPTADPRTGKAGRPMSERALRRTWGEAVTGWRAYREQQDARAAYLRAVEAAEDAEHMDTPARPAERAAMADWLDQWEAAVTNEPGDVHRAPVMNGD